MLRLDLLRSLTRPETRGGPHVQEAGEAGRPLRYTLAVLLLLLVGATLAVWMAKPEWLGLESGKGLWVREDAGRADSLERVAALHRQASRLVDARQKAAIDWLYELETVLPVAQNAGDLGLTRATFGAGGDFALEGTTRSAEALSAFQEAFVLIPGIVVRKSQASENPEQPGRFTFRFSGRIAPPPPPPHPPEGTDSGAGGAVETPTPRVVESTTLEARLDTLRAHAALSGISFAAPLEGKPTTSGGLQVHPFRLKGTVTPPSASDAQTDLGGALAFPTVRLFLEAERHRGSPFAVQRLIVTHNAGRSTVFLDILALSP